jgi:molybdopterin synthase sulfur carrier subunit
MMIKVEFLGPIQKAPIEVEAKSLEALSLILKAEPTMSEWLDTCAVAVNDTMVNDLSMKLEDGDRVSILPPVCGG